MITWYEWLLWYGVDLMWWSTIAIGIVAVLVVYWLRFYRWAMRVKRLRAKAIERKAMNIIHLWLEENREKVKDD